MQVREGFTNRAKLQFRGERDRLVEDDSGACFGPPGAGPQKVNYIWARSKVPGIWVPDAEGPEPQKRSRGRDRTNEQYALGMRSNEVDESDHESDCEARMTKLREYVIMNRTGMSKIINNDDGDFEGHVYTWEI